MTDRGRNRGQANRQEDSRSRPPPTLFGNVYEEPESYVQRSTDDPPSSREQSRARGSPVPHSVFLPGAAGPHRSLRERERSHTPEYISRPTQSTDASRYRERSQQRRASSQARATPDSSSAQAGPANPRGSASSPSNANGTLDGNGAANGYGPPNGIGSSARASSRAGFNSSRPNSRSQSGSDEDSTQDLPDEPQPHLTRTAAGEIGRFVLQHNGGRWRGQNSANRIQQEQRIQDIMDLNFAHNEDRRCFTDWLRWAGWGDYEPSLRAID